jgi:hypothetical protein
VIEMDVEQQDDGLQVSQPIPLTHLQVSGCFNLAIDLIRAQHLASSSLRDLTDTLPQNLLPEHQGSIAFLASAIEKVDAILADVVEELEVLRATIGHAGGESEPSMTGGRDDE